MKENRLLKIPVPVLVLDVVGVILIGIGLFDWTADTNLVPEHLQFENYYIVMVVCGALLTLPAMLHIIKISLGKEHNDT